MTLCFSPKSLFSLRTLLDETNFQIREEAVRTGLLVGFFTSIYKALLHFLGRICFYQFTLPTQNKSSEQKLGKNVPKKATDRRKSSARKGLRRRTWHSAVAGFFAGFSLLVMEKSWHRASALYMATRLVQCVYNYNKANGYFHFWGSSWDHGDSLLFAVSSAATSNSA